MKCDFQSLILCIGDAGGPPTYLNRSFSLQMGVVNRKNIQQLLYSIDATSCSTTFILEVFTLMIFKALDISLGSI